MKSKILIFLIAAVLCVTGCKKQQSLPAVEGNPAPDFKVVALDGASVRLEDLKGQVVMVNFWATWCPPCREEIPSLMKLNSVMAGKPFRMMAISIDEGGRDAVEGYFKSSGTVLPAALDTDRKIGNLYGITGVPETFIIDKKGVIVKKIIGPLPWDDPQVIGYLTALAGS